MKNESYDETKMKKLIEMVREMRDAQKMYFKKRDVCSLQAARILEREVDKAICDIVRSEQGDVQQGELDFYAETEQTR